MVGNGSAKVVPKGTAAGRLKSASLHGSGLTRSMLQEIGGFVADSEIGDEFYGCRGVDYWFVVDFYLVLLKMGVWVHPQLGLLCGAALPFFLFSRNSALLRKHIFFMIFK